ncbi:DUF3592 domain-containing protein [Nocardiopsis composta]|uniref:DUF3592 domain-containing protein n=1 Tax=Nocardiopsis composta TaxID=157465 RepID=A0A7W8QI30_9ACTN|nr:DUF3592 domain-containing protein [Nocardiopsis composta]MBB5430771.1 hypothetical protein [Nocardiopsis composta]
MGLLGLGVSSVGVALLFREFRLDLIGVRVPGKVVGIQGGRMSDGGGGGGGGGYKMPYSASVVQYRTLDGDVIRQPHVYRYGGSLRPPEAVGDTVEVLYLPKNPTVFRIAGEPFAAWIGSFLFGLGLSFLVFAAALDGVLPESASPGAACVGAVLLAFGIALIRSAQHKKADPRTRTAMGLCTMLFVLPGLLMFWSGVMG